MRLTSSIPRHFLLYGTLLSLPNLNSHLFRSTRVSWYQNVSIMDFVGAKGDGGGGGGNRSYKQMCKAPVKSLAPPNTPNLLQARCPSCHPTNSVKALKLCTEMNFCHMVLKFQTIVDFATIRGWWQWCQVDL